MVLFFMRGIAAFVLFLGAGTLAWSDGPHYLRWQDVQPLLAAFASSGEKIDIADSAAWSRWTWDRDIAIRGRIDHGIEDSISALIIFGSSYTTLPRIPSAADAVNAAGDLTAKARARLDAFVQALDEQDSDRLSLALEFLRRRRVTLEELRAFLAGNLRRFAIEGVADQQKQAQGREYTDEGISPEAPFLANFGIAEALRTLKTSNAFPAHIRRIAVIGPGLSIAGEAPAYDFCSPQIIQPFAVLEAVLRLGIASNDVQVTAIDVNPYVLAHLRAAKVHSQHYTIQLARATSTGWTSTAIDYFAHFGDVIGAPATAIPTQSGAEFRAVSVKPQNMTRLNVQELNIIVQSPAAQAFDLVIATNVLTNYGPFEQGLALANIATMLSHSGIVVTDGSLPAAKITDLEAAGTSFAPFSIDGSGDTLAMYRRK